MVKRLLSMILCAMLVGGSTAVLSGCDTKGEDLESRSATSEISSSNIQSTGSQDSSKSEIKQTVDTADISEKDGSSVNQAVNLFSAELFKRLYQSGENALVSPFSVYTDFAMLQNGAGGDTLTQMNEVLSGQFRYDNAVVCYANEPFKADVINEYLKSYMQRLSESDELQMANSAWFNGKNIATDKFISYSKEYFNADIINTPFDNKTVDKINEWTSDHTNHMINKVLDEVPQEATAYLLNALAFDGKWAEPYKDGEVNKDLFTNSKGQEQEVDFMSSTEGSYIDDGYATGFVKFYKNNNAEESNRYCFAALLPNEGITLDEYIENYMTDETISDNIKDAEDFDVIASIPKFEFDCSYEDDMKNALSGMGIRNAFENGSADFSRLSETRNDLYVGSVIHKAKITVDESGTKAAAVTVIEMEENCMEAYEVKEVKLDRPFLFVIYDSYENIPLFIGAVNNI